MNFQIFWLVSLGLIFFGVAEAQIGNYVDLCDEINCCPPGNSSYWFMRRGSGGTINSLRTECLLEYISSTTYRSRLVLIDSQKENDCLTKYIQREWDPTTPEKYAIGLTDVSIEGVWEWEDTIVGESRSLTVQHWSPGFPSGGLAKNCAYLEADTDDAHNGFWQDTSCTTDGFYGICERVLV